MGEKRMYAYKETFSCQIFTHFPRLSPVVILAHKITSTTVDVILSSTKVRAKLGEIRVAHGSFSDTFSLFTIIYLSRRLSIENVPVVSRLHFLF